ncbi:MAG: hypothetical protein AB8F74_06520, partial [Saprospiraceae bacterium]
SLVLDHEQLHFDISEIYARKFVQRIEQEVHSFKELQEKIDSIFSDIRKNLQLKQDEYDSEVYVDDSLQTKWSDWVNKELKSLDKYKTKELKISKRH